MRICGECKHARPPGAFGFRWECGHPMPLIVVEVKDRTIDSESAYCPCFTAKEEK